MTTAVASLSPWVPRLLLPLHFAQTSPLLTWVPFGRSPAHGQGAAGTPALGTSSSLGCCGSQAEIAKCSLLLCARLHIASFWGLPLAHASHVPSSTRGTSRHLDILQLSSLIVLLPSSCPVTTSLDSPFCCRGSWLSLLHLAAASHQALL